MKYVKPLKTPTVKILDHCGALKKNLNAGGLLQKHIKNSHSCDDCEYGAMPGCCLLCTL